MTEEALNLPVGATVQLQKDGPDESPRHMVRVVGYLPGGSLVVTTPTQEGRVQLVPEGRKFKVRMLRGDSVVGFSAKVLHSSIKPYPHLHLEYPGSFEQIVVRNSARVQTRLLCQVRNTREADDPQNFCECQIVDLSESGAKLSCLKPLGEAGDMLQINFDLEVLGRVENLSLVADLKNLQERLEEHEGKKRLTHLNGVQFRAVNRFHQVLLHAWVMERVASGNNSLEK